MHEQSFTRAIDSLREHTLAANLDLYRSGLARFTFGNASAIDRASGLVVIKPSGVSYDRLTTEMLVVTDLDGRVVEGSLRPSSDLPTHLVLYRAFDALGGLVHTHSHYATAWAQARREIPCFGTTHADYFRGSVPVTTPLGDGAVRGEYEANTGHAIVRCLGDRDPLDTPAALVCGHGSFCWGATVTDAVHNAEVLEEIAHLAYDTVVLEAAAEPIDAVLLERHFTRKHGRGAYYGQDR